MRLLRNILLIILIGVGIYYYLDMKDITPKNSLGSIRNFIKNNESLQDKELKTFDETSKFTLEGDLYKWIGKSASDLNNEFGSPIRVDKSAYGYDWWIYINESGEYIQFGIQDEKIVTLYAMGEELPINPIKIGMSHEEVNKQFELKKEVTYQTGMSSYTFKLKSDDLNTRALVKVDDELFMQLYFDAFTDELVGIRLLIGDVLLKQRSYEMVYRGPLPEEMDLTNEQWIRVEKGMEKQVFDLTNLIRLQHKKLQLSWDDKVSKVAFGHSEDMEKNAYFSHYGLDGSGLKERLGAERVLYLAAGENIAAQYPDAPAAVIGWLNSEGHREALLSADYTHLGVGVYKLYYTQNFIRKR